MSSARLVETAALVLCTVASLGAIGCSSDALIQTGSGGAGAGGTGAGGSAGGMPVSDNQGVYVQGKLDSGPDRIAFVGYPDSTTPSVLFLPELAALPNIWDFALAPQGDKMALSASSPEGMTALFAYAVDGTAPVSLIDLSTAPNFGWVHAERLQFSPDGQWLAFVMDPDIMNAHGLYVVPVDGSVPPRRVSQAITEADGVRFHSWSPDGQQLAYVADVGTASGVSLYVVDAMDPAATPVALLVTNGAQSGSEVGSEPPVWTGNGEQLYFISTHETGSLRRLYRINTDGSGLEQVPGTGLTNSNGEASVKAWALSPDRSRLAFSADAPDAGLHQIYVMDLPGGTPAAVSAVQTVPNSNGASQGPLSTDSLQWNPNGTSLAVVANWDAQANPNADFAVYVVPANGPAGGTRIMSHAGVAALLKEAGFSADGQRLYVLADLLGQSKPELFTTVDLTTADQDPLAARVFAPPTYDAILESYLPAP